VNILKSPSHEQDPRKLNAPMSQMLRAALLMRNEQSNILTSTEKPTNSKADPQTEPLSPQHPRRANPWRKKEDPLPAVRINSLEFHQGPPRLNQRSAYRENISL